MDRKLVLISFTVILLTSLLGVAFRVEKVQASGTIYIRVDGSIDPPTANITTVDNVTYTFTDNNYDEIVVERNNLVIDGAGYTLQGNGSEIGIDLSDRFNVTIKNMEIKAFSIGIWLNSSSSNVITRNDVTENFGKGVYLWASLDNTISSNNISKNPYGGLYLRNSSNNNTILANNITNNEDGILLQDSSNNTIF